MDLEFRWNDWNIDHIAEHRVDPADAEYVVNGARRPYPERASSTKWIVRGVLPSGRCLQVIYIFDPVDVAFVLHARPLTDKERHRYFRKPQ